jgi:initiation factor 1A
VQVWINQGDIILLSLRDFQDGKADVIVKYTADEARNLKVGLLCQRMAIALIQTCLGLR